VCKLSIPSLYHTDLKYFAFKAVYLDSCGRSALPKHVAGVDGTDTVLLRVAAGHVSIVGENNCVGLTQSDTDHTV
jgi:hypothetical protein